MPHTLYCLRASPKLQETRRYNLDVNNHDYVMDLPKRNPW